MRRTIGDMAEDGFRSEASWLQRQTPLGLLIKLVLVVIAISLVIGALGFVSGWFKTATDVVSPENVKNQYSFAYEYNNSLTASANNWCAAKKAETTAVGDDAKNERQSQTMAREANYNSIKSKYDAALQNAFKAKYVKPADVPVRAPTLQEKITELGLTC